MRFDSEKVCRQQDEILGKNVFSYLANKLHNHDKFKKTMVHQKEGMSSGRGFCSIIIQMTIVLATLGKRQQRFSLALNGFNNFLHFQIKENYIQ